ncbi:MAG: phosphate/phosphite/phosphonate ABC transporter substrate-binding protein [Dehalococcoidia bacterium]
MRPSSRESRKISRRQAIGSIGAGLLGAMIAGCSSGHIPIDFGRVEGTVEDPGARAAGAIRLAAAPMLSPGRTSSLYQDLGAYAAAQLGRPVELIQGKTYFEINELVRSGAVPVAMVCTYPYVLGHQDFGMELSAAPEINGAAEYYSYLVVPAESAARSLEDLRGASFAFTDPMSNSGRLVPMYQLATRGWTPPTFFSRTIFTYAHDRSVVAVGDGVVAGATVDSVVFDYLAAREPALTARVRVIERWGPYGGNPIVVDPRLQPELKADLQSVFIDMSKQPEGVAILKRLGVDRYIVPDDRSYNSVREMSQYLRSHGLVP